MFCLMAAFCATSLFAANCTSASGVSTNQVFSRDEVYKNMPFSAGEVSEFELKYYGVHVGFGSLEVKSPRKHEGKWVRVFSALGQTGDWYKNIFVARDFAEALSHPSDFAVEKFYLKQDEGKIFGKRLEQEKWFDFDQDHCVVKERIKKSGSPEVHEENTLIKGSMDALSAIFAMRARDFKIGKIETAQVHTSKKDWVLESAPEKFETITVPAGIFKTVKLKLKTYLGKDLQQKGDVYVWIATDHPQRPLVKMEGEIKLGSVAVNLFKFTPGNAK